MARAAGSLAEQVALGAMAVALGSSGSGVGSATVANDASSGDRASSARVVQLSSSSGGDSPLPAGWQRVTHDSGLPCYVHEQERLVCWSKPYVLDQLCSSSKFVDAVQQHVPPLRLFKVPPARETASGNQQQQQQQIKKRKLRAPEPERQQEATTAAKAAVPAPALEKPQELPKEQDPQPSMTFEEFKALPISDPRILQVCAELSYKTPAQVLQEYQNRNRGISINYNTHSIDQDGAKLFKTIVSTGSTAAEGIASTKRVAKQLGAQSLLGMLHERTAKTYYAIAELYSSTAKNPTAIGDSSSTHVFAPANGYGGRDEVYRRAVDPRLNRSAAPAVAAGAGAGTAGGAGRGKKRDRRSGGSIGGGTFAVDYSGEGVGEYLEASAAATAAGYPQAARGYWGGGGGGYPPHYGSSGAWRSERGAYASEQRGDERERVVEYSQAPPAYAYSQQQQQQQQYYYDYYGNEAAAYGYGGSGGAGVGGDGERGGSGHPPYAAAGAGVAATAAAGAGAGAHGYGSAPPPGYGLAPAVGAYGAPDSRYYAQQQQPPQRSQAPPVEGVYGQLKVRRRTDP